MYLTLENILSGTTEWSIYSYYLGDSIDLKKSYRIPWREDNMPSMKLFKHRDSSRTLQIWWRDVTRDTSGDIINLVQRMYSLTFFEALVKINIDLNLNLTYDERKYQVKASEKPAVPLDYTVEVVDTKIGFQLNKYNGKHVFTKTDLKYWKERCITKEDLIREKIFSIAKVYANGSPIWSYHKNNPIYLYSYSYENVDYFKIYRPLMLNKKGKWLSNLNDISTKAIDGICDIPNAGEVLIITGSKKDKMVINKLGYPALGLQSESTFIDMELWNSMELHSRFRWIYSLFDNDKTGFEMGKQFSETYGTMPIWLPQEYGKDIDEVIVHNGFNDAKIILDSIL